MICKICSNKSTLKGEATLLQKYKVKYYCCDNCGFIQTEDPYWLDEAYNSAINYTDTGILSRNLLLAGVTKIVIKSFFKNNDKFCDYAGGYGLFTRLMRDYGYDFLWYDPYCSNLTARGFEYHENMGKLSLVTAFEVMEHLTEPVADIKKMLSFSNSILFTTELYDKNKMPPLNQWWYYGLEHGQHVAIYCKETLEIIARELGLNFYTDGRSVHMMTDLKINPLLFKLLVKTGRRKFVASMLNNKSKTVQDMNYLKNVLQTR
jgi:hypothetical protein